MHVTVVPVLHELDEAVVPVGHTTVLPEFTQVTVRGRGVVVDPEGANTVLKPHVTHEAEYSTVVAALYGSHVKMLSAVHLAVAARRHDSQVVYPGVITVAQRPWEG